MAKSCVSFASYFFLARRFSFSHTKKIVTGHCLHFSIVYVNISRRHCARYRLSIWRLYSFLRWQTETVQQGSAKQSDSRMFLSHPSPSSFSCSHDIFSFPFYFAVGTNENSKWQQYRSSSAYTMSFSHNNVLFRLKTTEIFSEFHNKW